MKKQNDIDQLFESKLNKQTFDLKDAYVADFESQLAVYNKKGKGLFWFIFGSLVAFTILFDFVILPNQTTTSNYQTTKIKATNFDLEITPSKNKVDKHLKTETSPSTFSPLIEPNSNNEVKSTGNSNNKSTLIKKQVSPISPNKNKQNNTTQLSKTEAAITEKKKDKITTLNAISPVKSDQNLEIIKTLDVYLDDTIRRQVIIIDTVITRDTIIITDTIKNKIRLFKKKR